MANPNTPAPKIIKLHQKSKIIRIEINLDNYQTRNNEYI